MHRNLTTLVSLLLLSALLSACTLFHSSGKEKDVDEFEPMPAATEDTPDPAADKKVPKLIPIPDKDDEAAADDSQDLWSRIRDGYQLDIPEHNQRIAQHKEKYTSYPVHVNKILQRGGRYLYHIVEEADKRDMPLELALLPMIESAYDPFAHSSGFAAGLWQFIPSTGKAFDLKQSAWLDDRMDLLHSTDAALDYLEELVKRFDGDWLLALASYNAGAGNVSRAIRKNKKNGKDTDFWNLSLPNETMDYVPKLLAIADIIKDPQQYGMELPNLPNKPYFKVVEIPGQLDLEVASDLAGISLKELQWLNAGFLRFATPPNGPNRLLIPAKKADNFKVEVAELPAYERINVLYYKVEEGDTLSSIAKKKGVTVASIKRSNNIKSDKLKEGKRLLIANPHRNDGKDEPSEEIHYTVKSGDNLWSIADKHSVTIEQVEELNNIKSDTPLKVGQELVLQEASNVYDEDDMGYSSRDYKVEAGDTLYAIARKFDVSVQELESWNPGRTGHLQPGEKLIVFADAQ